jgi:hypothetical protein
VAPGLRGVTVNLAESPPDGSTRSRRLSDRLFDAGERLRADYERVQIAPGVTMRWEPVRIRSTNDEALTPGERQVAVRRRLDGVIAAAGKRLADILW